MTGDSTSVASPTQEAEVVGHSFFLNRNNHIFVFFEVASYTG